MREELYVLKSTPVVNQIKHGLTPRPHCVAHVRTMKNRKLMSEEHLTVRHEHEKI